MADTTAGTASASIKWDEWFSEESDELVFVSLDRIHFRAGRKRIGSVSSVIKDMLSAHQPSGNGTSPPAATGTTTPIELDYTARVIRVFLMKAYRMLAPQDPNRLFLSEKYFDDYAEGIQVYNLLRYLDCPGLIQGTHSEMASAAHKERKCRDLLVLASNNADVGLGTRAMCEFGRKELDTLYASQDDMNSYLDQLRPTWATFLRSKVIITDQNGQSKLRPQNENKWRHISMDFDYEVGVAEGRYAPRPQGLFSFGYTYAPSNVSSTNATAGATTSANNATTGSSTRPAAAPSANSNSSATAVVLQPPSVPANNTGFTFGGRTAPVPTGNNTGFTFGGRSAPSTTANNTGFTLGGRSAPAATANNSNDQALGNFQFGGPTTSALVPAGSHTVSAPTSVNVGGTANGAFGFSANPAAFGGNSGSFASAFHITRTTTTATFGMPSGSGQTGAGNFGFLNHFLANSPAFGQGLSAFNNNTASPGAFGFNASNGSSGATYVAAAWGVFASST